MDPSQFRPLLEPNLDKLQIPQQRARTLSAPTSASPTRPLSLGSIQELEEGGVTPTTPHPNNNLSPPQLETNGRANGSPNGSAKGKGKGSSIPFLSRSPSTPGTRSASSSPGRPSLRSSQSLKLTASSLSRPITQGWTRLRTRSQGHASAPKPFSPTHVSPLSPPRAFESLLALTEGLDIKPTTATASGSSLAGSSTPNLNSESPNAGSQHQQDSTSSIQPASDASASVDTKDGSTPLVEPSDATVLPSISAPDPKVSIEEETKITSDQTSGEQLPQHSSRPVTPIPTIDVPLPITPNQRIRRLASRSSLSSSIISGTPSKRVEKDPTIPFSRSSSPVNDGLAAVAQDVAEGAVDKDAKVAEDTTGGEDKGEFELVDAVTRHSRAVSGETLVEVDDPVDNAQEATFEGDEQSAHGMEASLTSTLHDSDMFASAGSVKPLDETDISKMPSIPDMESDSDVSTQLKKILKANMENGRLPSTKEDLVDSVYEVPSTPPRADANQTRADPVSVSSQGDEYIPPHEDEVDPTLFAKGPTEPKESGAESVVDLVSSILHASPMQRDPSIPFSRPASPSAPSLLGAATANANDVSDAKSTTAKDPDAGSVSKDELEIHHVEPETPERPSVPPRSFSPTSYFRSQVASGLDTTPSTPPLASVPLSDSWVSVSNNHVHDHQFETPPPNVGYSTPQSRDREKERESFVNAPAYHDKRLSSRTYIPPISWVGGSSSAANGHAAAAEILLRGEKDRPLHSGIGLLPSPLPSPDLRRERERDVVRSRSFADRDLSRSRAMSVNSTPASPPRPTHSRWATMDGHSPPPSRPLSRLSMMSGMSGSSFLSYPQGGDIRSLKLPQHGFRREYRFNELKAENRFLFRVYTPHDDAASEMDDHDLYFMGGKFKSREEAVSAIEEDEGVFSFESVARHMDWTTRGRSGYVTTSFSFAWAVWEASKRREEGIKRDVRIAVIDAWKLGEGRAATAVEVLSEGSEEKRDAEYWKWYRFGLEAQDVLVYGGIPADAIFGSVRVSDVMGCVPGYWLDEKLPPSPPNSDSEDVWEPRKVTGSVWKKKQSFRRFRKAVSAVWGDMLESARARERTSGAVRCALALMRPWVHARASEDDDEVVSVVSQLARVVARWAGGDEEGEEEREHVIRAVVKDVKTKRTGKFLGRIVPPVESGVQTESPPLKRDAGMQTEENPREESGDEEGEGWTFSTRQWAVTTWLAGVFVSVLILNLRPNPRDVVYSNLFT